MNALPIRPSILAAALILVGVTIGCQEQVVDPSVGESAIGDEASQWPSDVDLLSKSGPPSTATVQFGRNELGSPFPPPEEHDASTHAKDALQPRTVVISAGGTVTFSVASFHKIAIYEPGTTPDEIDTTLLEPSGAPFPFPPIINDPTGRITRGALALPGPDVAFSWTFDEPGRYLVICEVLPHFAAMGMYGWVIVK